MSFEGVHTPLVTPFKADGEIDHTLLGKHAANLAGRVSGLGIGGTTGEYYALSFDERVQTFNTVAEAAGGKTWLTAGMSIAFLMTGDPTWVIAAANFCYLIGICMPSVAVATWSSA